ALEPKVASETLDIRAIQAPAVEPVEFELRPGPVTGEFCSNGAAIVVGVIPDDRLALRFSREQRIARQHRPIGTSAELAGFVAMFVAQGETVPACNIAADLYEPKLLLCSGAPDGVAVAVLELILVGIDIGTDD